MSKFRQINKLLGLLAVLLAFFVTQNSWAVTKTYVSGSTWGVGGDIVWSPVGQPSGSDDVIIPTGATLSTFAAIAAKTITINGTSTLTIDHQADIAQSVAGGITLNGTSQLIVNAAVAVNIGTATYQGDIVLNDNSTLSFATAIATVTLSGTWTKGADATITNAFPPNLSFLGTTALSLPSTLNSANAIVVDKSGSTVTLNGDLTVAALGAFTLTAGTFIVGDNDLTLTAGAGGSTISAGATLNANYTDATVLRTFGKALALDGTLNSSGPRHATATNNIFNATGVITFAATGVLNVANSVTSIAVVPAAFPVGAVITATGASLTYSGIFYNFSSGTINTNSNTDLVFTSTTGGNLTLPSSITNLHSLTINSATGVTHIIVLSADLTIAQNLAIPGGRLNATGKTVVINGAFSKGIVGVSILDATGATFTFNGSAAFGAADAGLITTLATSITFNGSGAITFFPGVARDLNKLTYNKTGVSTILTGQVITFLGTSPEFNITAGTIVAAVDLQFVTTGAATTISSNGTLDLVTYINTFAGSVTGTGTLDADRVGGAGLIFSGQYSFTGNLQTSALTVLTFDTHATDVILNSSVTNLLTLKFDRATYTLTLNNNLTFAGAITALLFLNGTIDVNGYTATFSDAFTAENTCTLKASNSSLIFIGAAVFTTGTYTIDETTNLEFRVAPTLVAGLTKCKNLTIVGATTVTQLAALDIYGNLDIASGCQLDKGAFNLTVRGDVTNLGTMTLSGAGGITTLYGSLQGEGIYTALPANTDVVINGTGSQLVFPGTFGNAGAIRNLTINRASGAKLNRILTIGAAAAGILTLTSGDLDLNGYVLTLDFAGVTPCIVESAGNTIINTGASGGSNGYVTLTTTVLANIEASGIGVITATGAGATTVRRYPKTVPVPGVGLSTARIFYISNATAITALTLQFDNTELYSSASDLKVYSSISDNFAVKTNLSDEYVSAASYVTSTVSVNTPSAGFGRVALTQTGTALQLKLAALGTNYFALAAVPGAGGVMYTYSGADNGYWSTSTNWTPNGVPSKVDQVVIGPNTVVLKGEGSIAECKTLVLNHPNATLLPYNNGLTGDNTSLRVMGNITLNNAPGAEILGVNGKGKLNLIIGDGVTVGVSSLISVNNSYVTTDGIWVNNLTINMADVTMSTNNIRISGDVTLLSNCAVTQANIEFWGGTNALQTLTIPSSAILTIQNARFDNNANVTTPSNFELTSQFLVKNGSTFNATNGTALFSDPNGSGTPWIVENGGTLKFYNVEFNALLVSGSFIPLGNAYIQGNFYQYNTAVFVPASGTVIFQNSGQKEIVNTKSATDLIFYNLQVTTGSNVTTSNSWQVSSEIDVKANATFTADNGTISFVTVTPASKYIKNASNHTLEFNNLTLSAGTVYTSDSWTIKGDLTTTTSLIADNGTITFSNVQEKTITTNAATPPTTFYKLLVADGSKVTTSAVAADDFTIANNATNPTGAGIEVAGTGEFYVSLPGSVITFDAGIGVASGYPKTITKSSSGRLEFGLLAITATPNNEVSTASNFTITGTGAATFNNAGAGGKFTATAGTVTFTGSAPVIASVSPAVTNFYSILAKGTTTLTLTALQEMYISGDLAVNDQSSFGPAAVTSKVIFNGNTLQTISGSSTDFVPVAFADLVINKANNSELFLGTNTTINSDATIELTLTNGILNLGSATLTNAAGIISRTNGVINGNTGTYIVSGLHQGTLLEDAYFTVNGTPTLYNLTVNAAHTTANDLTVNGTLNLNTANLTIGSSINNISNPIKLILNGNLTRATGIIAGSPIYSRLVLQGSGSITGGLNNNYFGGTATTVQLEVARQDSLGGNLDIVNTSYLRVNTGINTFNIGAHTLTFLTSFNIVMLSGGIEASLGKVIIPTAATIPASLFRNNTVKNLTIGGDIILAGDLTITGILSGVWNITTKDNLLTFGPDVTLPIFTTAKHIIGNLRRTVTNTATTFSLGNTTALIPVTMKFANGGSSQLITASIRQVNPVYGRGGNANNAVKLEWSFTPEGTTPTDSMKIIFNYPSSFDAAVTPATNATFPAKWMRTYWQDYRNNIASLTGTDPKILTLASYPLLSSEYLSGTWAVFSSSANTDASKDAAIAMTKNRIVIKSITPIPVLANGAFKVNVELQDQSGVAITATVPFKFNITEIITGTYSGASGVIPAGSSSTTISGLVFTSAAILNQLKVDTIGSSVNWNPGLSDVFAILPVMPTAQSNTIKFTNVKETSMTIDWTSAGGAYNLVVIKADTLLLDSEYPVSGTTYYANTIMGAASSLGSASVIFNGGTGTSTVNVTGLSPNTTYTVYVFTYDMNGTGNERYRTTAASGNPKSQKTLGSYDDDVTLGANNTRETSKTIGTQTPFSGTIKTADDVDWFNFTVTSASPNIRGTLVLTSDMGNYNVELYNMEGRRMRRGTRLSYNNEAQVINYLPAGTYTVKVMGVNGAYSATKPYSLKITTSSNEIFSVTP